MFDPSSQQHHPQPPLDLHHLPSHSHNRTMYNLEKKESDNKAPSDFPFCYNVSTLPKGQHQGGSGMVDRFEGGQPFNYNYALVNQMSLGSSNANFKCDICGLVFAHIALLNHHKRIHAESGDIELFTCELCNSSFTQVSDLKVHKETAHNATSSQSNKSCDIGCQAGDDNKNDFKKCDSCIDGSHSSGEDSCGHHSEPEHVQTPQKGHYPVKKRKLGTVAKCHKCCGTGIIIVGSTVHNIAVEKPYRCNLCDSTFSRYSSLWSHRRLHSGEKPFKCDICGLAFARSSSLKNHTRVHTGERPYKCGVCGMQFSQAPHLKNHERIHSGERPYECDLCGKHFARHSTLWNHRRIHTGEKPYRCEICGSAFNQASHLKNHTKVHTGEKPHKCDICDVGFSDRFALKRHRGIHEKYGQTGPNQPARAPVSSDNTTPQESWKSTPSQQNTQGSRMENPMYKCDSTSIKSSQGTQPPPMENIYVPGSIAFPGCSRPPEK